ncbi:hypothetical protein ACFV97_25540 [Streptomyces sp. NPDC059913]|uniref:hypothetical protein n=1 Tax=unclassified Streptomyces TaxID=2593676 RepID=UPI00365C9A63
MPSHYGSLPDVAFGHDPHYGIVAANPKQLGATEQLLMQFDFHPVPNQPTLYALADQQLDGHGRTARAVELLRRTGYQVDVDAALDSSLATDASPAVAIAEHPRLGIIGATDDRSFALGGRLILEEHGWAHDPAMDVYTLPVTSRADAMKVATRTVVSMQRSGLKVAVHPDLAQDMAAHSLAASESPERNRGAPARPLPVSTAALTTSPARNGLPDKAPGPTHTSAATAGRPVDPRIAFSRTR